MLSLWAKSLWQEFWSDYEYPFLTRHLYANLNVIKVTCHVKNLSKVVMLKIETILQFTTKLSKLKLFQSKTKNCITIYGHCKSRKQENWTKDSSLSQKLNIGSKSLNLRKKAGVKFNDLFLWTKWLERIFSYLSMILPSDFSEILNICQNYSLFSVSAHFMMWRHQISEPQTRRVKEFWTIPYCRHP